MNIIDFTQLGGYRLEQPTLAKLQSNVFEVLNAFMGHLNVPTSGNFIVTGCELVSGDITPGIMYIDGALCPFIGTTGGTSTNATKIKKNVVNAQLSFENGTTPAVFTNIDAIVDPTGVALSAFIRIPKISAIPWANLINVPANLVYDANYVHTDVNFTLALWAKLMAIEDLAEVNVQADWNEINNLADAYIKNKPIIPIFLKIASVVVADIGGTDQVTVNFPDVGTSDYAVFLMPCLNPASTSWQDTLNFFWTAGMKTNTSFKLFLRELQTPYQALQFDYMLVKYT